LSSSPQKTPSKNTWLTVVALIRGAAAEVCVTLFLPS